MGQDADDRPSPIRARLERVRDRRTSGVAPRRDEEIGAGGMGVVHRVWDDEVGRPLAMKVLRDRSDLTEAERDELLDRFHAEAQITGQLEHPSIVSVHEFGVDEDGAPYFTMPLVRGETLQAVIGELHDGSGTWTRERVLGVVLKAADALAYAHSKGVVHRDVKPANIMVGRFGEVYVMDWGLAKRVGDASAARTSAVHTDREDDEAYATGGDRMLGTLVFMPPEHVRGDVADVSPAVDVYGLGAVLYTLLAGRPPYVEPNETPRVDDLRARIEGGPPAPLGRDVPVELVAIVERAMARERGARFERMSDLAAQLRAFLEGRVVEAYRTGALVELRKWVGRNRLAATLLGVILVGGASFAIAQSRSNARLRDTNDDLAREIRENSLLTDVLLARELLAEDGTHVPDGVGITALARWIERSRDLVARRSAAGAFDVEAEGVSDAERAAGRADVALLAGRLPAAERRLAAWRDLERRSIDAHRNAWDEARTDVAELDVYGGLDLASQVGLVPLGRNADTGLWEFWHVLSGAPPERGDDGHWHVTPDTGLVLVLVPGGACTVGATPGDPDTQVNEAPRDVELEPFFIAAHEVTQAQYERAIGDNPSFLADGDRFGASPVVASPTHPVESVTFLEAHALARQYGLELPTEEQWEYAARAGTRTVYHAGDDPSCLEGTSNIGDRSLIEANAVYADVVAAAPWHDGYAGHAPVGSFTPNAFGLYDVHGNVAEWTRSAYVSDPRDGVPSADDDDERVERVRRGGYYVFGPHVARLALRQHVAASNREQVVGARLARPLER